MTDFNNNKALVIGSGIGGLLTARMLSDHFQEVLVIERDTLPERPVNRPGTPQAFHPHRLTPRGMMIMERLFPGYNEELLANGAFSPKNKKLRIINEYGTMTLPNPGNEATFSRALLEWVFRQRLQEYSNIRFFTQQEVIGLKTTEDLSTVTGVQIRERGSSRQEKTITADLVIDVSGRSSKLVKWLPMLGYEVPTPDRLQVSFGYSTRHYQVPSQVEKEWDAIRIEGKPGTGSMTGVMSIIENHIAEVVLWSVGENRYPSTDAQSYEQELTQLDSPLLSQVIQDAKPITNPRGYRIAELTRQRFEQMNRWPSGLIVLGDAFCTFDPYYGLGMTIAAIEVEILEGCLKEQQVNPNSNFERQVLQKMQDIIEPAWWLNAVADLRWPGVKYVGQPMKGIEFTQKYFDLLLRFVISHENYDLYGMYWLVNSLFQSPQELINPEIMETVLSASTEGQQWWAELTKESGSLTREGLDELIPSFSSAAFVDISLLNQ